MRRIAVAGAGNMARVRARALQETGKMTVCGVAARTSASAGAFGAEIGCDECFDDYRKLAQTSPDALLVEVPHGVQDEIVLWALEQGFHVLVGSTLATSMAAANAIAQAARLKSLTVEAGHACRYSEMWIEARRIVRDGDLGRIILARTLALFDADPKSWYYRQDMSGGMPMIHMTYGFINPVRWFLGEPVRVSAFANRLKHTSPGMVDEETCVANLMFDNDAVCTMTASYICPGNLPGWSLLFLGTDGALEMEPASNSLTIRTNKKTRVREFSSEKDANIAQAEAFVATIEGADECRNRPEESAGDVAVAEAIVASVRSGTIVHLAARERSRV
jgi:myo-inositol 2-dehydrogenase/D-chiro-inositol 1-dehydrogenase